ncbi:juvenile hormone acid O-methyltransferase-like isoform X2 [Anneissia japonica]|uniref:juvenile hormone acid O-methyltransferase-like isoform X2 n=1 Tax=Anneissia japonica TaxID=1529436 RepID=UPI001425AB20|nr:juvenile hormone acid O-methyltransferase-like isoform X2 [Anneissia japonica]XP_033124537.1 juvenile hormone acid O-methyltransferase-like isoform X2 [Anneissia japonica]
MNSKEAALYSKTRGFQVATYRLYVPDFEIKADDKILDVGCGTGDLAYEFGDVAQSVIGFDISKEMINFARHSYKRPNVTYELADVLSCVDIFPDWKGAFDKVVSIHVLHWVKDRKGAFQSIHDCLKPGGECFLLISGPMNQIMGHGDDELPHYLKNHDKWKEHLKGYENKFYNRLTLEDNVKLLESVGFEVVKGHSYKPCDELDIDKDQIKASGCARNSPEKESLVPVSEVLGPE